MTAGAEPARAATCPVCGQAVWPDDNFCEACRGELSPALVSGDQAETPAQCPSCRGAPVTEDGYCESCGHRVPAAADHTELDLGAIAGVTDRGLRHSRNADARGLAVAQTGDGPAAVAVVCDGVSTSTRPDEAAQAGVQAAVRVLLTAVRNGDDLAHASAQAFTAAQQALSDLADERWPRVNAPSATFRTAIVTQLSVAACWLGGSRPRWLAAPDPAPAEPLTPDDPRR